MRFDRTIPNTILRNWVAVATVSALLAGGLWVRSEAVRFREDSEKLRASLTEARKRELRGHVDRTLGFIEFMKSKTEERAKEDARSRVLEAHALASRIWELSGGGGRRAEVVTLVREALRSVRFNGGRGYYFAFSLDGIDQLADDPALEGKHVVDLRDSRGAYLFRDMIELAKGQGEGFYSYSWTKPGVPGRDFRKVSFVKLFEPLGWVLGTGEYLDDVAAEIQRETLERVEKIRFGRDGYVFVGTFAGLSLTPPAKGRNMLDITDQNGVKLVQELIACAKAGGGFVTYVMPELEGRRSAPKLSYAAGVDEWQWYVGAGAYVDDIEAEIRQARAIMRERLWWSVGRSLGLLAVLLVGALWAATRTARRTRRTFDVFSSFFERAARESARIEPERLDFSEFRALAAAANRMLDDRQRAQEDLRVSEDRFRRVAEHLPLALGVSDAQGRIVFVNRRHQELFGFKPEEILSVEQWFARAYPDKGHRRDVVAQWSEDVRRVRSGQLTHSPLRIYRMTCADGTVKEVETGFSLEGEMTYVVFNDATERKIAENALRENEEKLRESEALLRTTIESLPLEFFCLEAGGRYVMQNTVCREHWGDVVGKRPEEIAPDAATLSIWAENNRRVLGGETIQGQIEFAVRGEKRSFFQIITPLRREDEITGIVGVNIDVTERERAEEERAALQERLQQAQKMEALGTLSGGIAHDFNNLLQVIAGRVELLQRGPTNQESLGESLRVIAQAARRAAELVRSLLTFAHRGKRERRPVDLNEEVRTTVQMLERTIPKMIVIAPDLAEELLPVSADPSQIEQVLINLVANARDAMPEGGKVVLRTQNVSRWSDFQRVHPEAKEGTYVEISVEDNGAGMDQATADRMFEPFFTTKQVGQGTGLGLAVVYGIVKDHDGYIDCETAPGRGTAFRIYLPALENPDGPTSDEPPLVEPTTRGRGTILVVEDEEAVSDVIRDGLKDAGYEVLLAATGEECLEFYKRVGSTVALVVLDVGMPGMGGRACLQELRKIDSEVKILVASGYGEALTATFGGFGATEFLPKPYRLADLTRKIQQLLGR